MSSRVLTTNYTDANDVVALDELARLNGGEIRQGRKRNLLVLVPAREICSVDFSLECGADVLKIDVEA